VAAVPSAFATDFDQNGIATIDFPILGVQLGQGVDLSTGLSFGTCVEGAAPGVIGSTARTPQTVSVSLRNNKDASTYFQELDVSASAQAAFLAAPISANIKTKYVTKHQFDQTTDTISIYERIEQHEYLSPSAGAAAPPEIQGQRVNTSAFNNIRLNGPAAKLLADGNVVQFQRECGSGFVAVLIEGGELTATLTVQDHKATDSSSLDLTAGVSFFGSNVSSSVQSLIDNSSDGHSVALDFLASGGSGDPVPVDKDKLLDRVRNLAQDVTNPPAPFQVIVRSYRSLPNFPANVPPFEKPEPLDDIMTLYWRLDAILTQAIISSRPVTATQFGSPFPSPNQSVLIGFNSAFPDQINKLVDQLTQKRTALATQASDCFTNHRCGPPLISLIDVYSLAAQLPLPIAADTVNLQMYRQVLTTLRTSIFTFNVAKSRAIANALGAFGKGPGPEPNCAAQNSSVNAELANQREPLMAAVNTAEQFIETTAPALLLDDAINFFVRGPKQAHCSPSPFDQDCKLTNADIEQIKHSVPVRDGVQITLLDPAHIDDFGGCPFLTGGPVPLADFALIPKP
jgi:hypothetical protein